MPWYDYICTKCEREIHNLMRSVSNRDGEPSKEEGGGQCTADFEDCTFMRKFEIPTYLPHVITNGHQRGFAKEALEQARLEESAIDEMNPDTRKAMEHEAKEITRIRSMPNS